MSILLYALIGFIGGIFSGAFGIGGGAIMVPLLVLWFGLTQHQAQGTILAVLMIPVGFLAVLKYYSAGNVKVQIAFLVAMGFILGALLGAQLVHGLSDAQLKKAFGIFLILVGAKYLFLK